MNTIILEQQRSGCYEYTWHSVYVSFELTQQCRWWVEQKDADATKKLAKGVIIELFDNETALVNNPSRDKLWLHMLELTAGLMIKEKAEIK